MCAVRILIVKEATGNISIRISRSIHWWELVIPNLFSRVSFFSSLFLFFIFFFLWKGNYLGFPISRENIYRVNWMHFSKLWLNGPFLNQNISFPLLITTSPIIVGMGSAIKKFIRQREKGTVMNARYNYIVLPSR